MIRPGSRFVHFQAERRLDYRYAFGGHYSLPDEDALTNTLYYPDNPAGRGWLPSRADYKRVSSEVARHLKPDLNAVTRLPAPQLEDPDWLVTSPFDRPAPAGFGPIAPWWEPRVSYQGTFDDHWRTQRLPYWPEDLDYRFHHSAPSDLVAPDYLVGSDGRRVYKNLTDIDPGAPTFVDRSVHRSIRQKINDGWTNVDLMRQGYAPIGSDGKQMNLHHILGQESGPMVELTTTTHQNFSRQLHGLIEDGRSFRNDPILNRQYNGFRRECGKHVLKISNKVA